MSYIDWTVLASSLLLIILYGIWTGNHKHTTESYLRGTQPVPWYTIGLSVMATQASAITFISLPGQAFEDGLRFIQVYFGLPIAMVVICATFIPIFQSFKVYTAYEFLEQRFDGNTRTLTAIIFLVQRGLGTGISMYAPSLVLAVLLGINTFYTNIIVGIGVALYTVWGGTKAVSHTHHYQMLAVLLILIFTGFYIVFLLPSEVSFADSLSIAGALGKMNAIDLNFDPTGKYNIWTGLIGGFFLALAYFGTDQSQVSRYITGNSVTESRLGLIFNGLIKIPMQFGILLIGILVYVYYIFYAPPVYFNKVKEKNWLSIHNTINKPYQDYIQMYEARKQSALNYANNTDTHHKSKLIEVNKQYLNSKKAYYSTLPQADDEKDTNYVFLRFVLDNLPIGMIGLLIAMIFSASMSSMSSGLNALAAASLIDVYKKSFVKSASDGHYVFIGRIFTAFWGILCIFFAEMAAKSGSLIEVVNVLGSLFYGTVLGVFLSAFYIKYIRAQAVFYAVCISQCIIFLLYIYTKTPFLWYNLIGAALVIIIASTIQTIFNILSWSKQARMP
ncbi:MAG: sodium:solute symporter [Cytophagales bacterium]|nr:sodium:solute symporter [Cytophagales bacterium]